MSFELIEFHAARDPHAVAMVDATGAVFTYEHTRRAIAGLATQLRLALPDVLERQPVGVCCADRRWHLLLDLALEALGVTTIAFTLPLDPGILAALQRCALIIADAPVEHLRVPSLILQPSWLEAGAGPDAEAFCAFRWPNDRVVSFLLTSGSQGNAKAIALHKGARDLREYNRIWRYGLNVTSRYLVALPISVGNIGITARAVLRCGAQLVFWRDADPLAALADITHTTMLPNHVRTLLQRIAVDTRPKPPPFKLFSVGAPLSAELRSRARALLDVQIENFYGSNEIGGCALIDAEGLGWVLPGVELEIVDEQLQPVPLGVVGMIRVRSGEMAHAYMDDALTQERFQEGWFLTGDQGVFLSRQRFRLLGRLDGMLNLGGVKVAPEEIEEVLLQHGLAVDLAVCSLADADGIGELYIALAASSLNDAAMIDRVRHALGTNFGHVRIIRVAAIPRNRSGKIQRAALAEQVRLHLGR